MKLIKYAKTDRYIIAAEVGMDETILGYRVCDMDMVPYGERFEFAADAILWADGNN